MARKTLIFYVFVSFLLMSLFAIFLPEWMSSPIIIILFAVIFRYIIGTYWKDSFKLAVINYAWILIFSLVLITAKLIMTTRGQNTSGTGLIWAFFLMIIGIPLTTIVINWTGNKHFEYSLFDKIIYKIKGLSGGKPNFKKETYRKNSDRIVYIIIVILIVVILIMYFKPFRDISFNNLINSNKTLYSSKIDLLKCGMSNQELFDLLGEPTKVVMWEVDPNNPDSEGEPIAFIFNYGTYEIYTQGQYFSHMGRVAMLQATITDKETGKIIKQFDCIPNDFS